MTARAWALGLGLATGLVGCGEGAGGIDLTAPINDLDPAMPPAKLSAWNLFAWDTATSALTWNDSDGRLLPYDLNVPLFSDFAQKDRAIYVPPGAVGTFAPELAMDLPVGSILVKNFAFPADFRAPTDSVTLIETRLLVRATTGWTPLPYVWDADGADATYAPGGDVRAISFIDAAGVPTTSAYLLPQRNQCQSCHARKPSPEADLELVPLGIKARHLHRLGPTGSQQLTAMASAGLLTGVPALDQLAPAYDLTTLDQTGAAAIPAGDVEAATRSYLDINCAHCHAPDGVQGITSQLFLNHDNTDTFRLGVCKRPGSAGAGTGGFEFDIVPGDASTSILYFRVHTDQVGAMMPLLGRSLVHVEGAALIRRWIDAMPADDCMGAP